jgi:hypothetical protein
MATYVAQTPTGKEEYDGVINLSNVTEELLNGFFCHYEPPTSDNAQFKAARAARADPTKYSDRPIARPILRTPTLHPKNRKKGSARGAPAAAVGTSKSGNRSDAATAGGISQSPSAGGASSGKSVTWRDEQANNERNAVEKEVVGCAINYCGIFQQGEGLTDVLMTPAEKAAAAKAAKAGAAKAKKVSRKKKSPAGGGTPTSTSSAQTDESPDSNGSKNRLTTILMNRNSKTKQDSPSPAPDTPVIEKRILYDDLGNPIAEDETDEETTVGPEESDLDTPAPPTSPATVTATPVNSNHPLAFLFSVPTVVIGAATIAAASAAEAVGYKLVPKDTPAEASPTPEATPLPSILRRPGSSDTNTGIVADGRDETDDVYEPVDYNNPFPHITRDPKRGPAYKRVRSPPIRRRQPTPRRARGMSARYEDELYDEERSTRKGIDEDEISSLGKLPRQSTGTCDTTAARQSPHIHRRQDLSPSTITEATSYHYEKDVSGRRLRPGRSADRRSDTYGDLTREEEEHIFYQSPTKNGASVNREDNDWEIEYQPQRRSRDEMVEGQTGMYSEQLRENRSGRHSFGADASNRLRMLYGVDEEEPLSPRQYAERFGRQRWEGYCEHGKKVPRGKDDGVMEEAESDADENLSPRQYAEKYRELRAAENDEEMSRESSKRKPQCAEKVEASSQVCSGVGKKASNPHEKKAVGAAEASRQKASKGSNKRKKTKPEKSQATERVEATSQQKREGSSKRKEIKPEPSQERRQASDPDTDIDPQDKVSDVRDPTPRHSVDARDADHTKRSEQLPATPRRDSQDSQEKSKRSQEKTRESAMGIPESNSFFDFSQKSLDKLIDITLDPFSPKSMATDDEIREEVSSVGMASATIRSLYYDCPFMNHPVTVEEEQNIPMGVIPLKQGGDLEQSTLSGSESTLSSKPTTKTASHSSQKKHTGGDKTHRDIQNTFSGSTRSKKLWRGWKQTLGKVKKIVHDIDEQRIHPPQLGHSLNVQG